MTKAFKEQLAIIDNITWLQKFVGQCLGSLKEPLVILSSSSSMQANMGRFRHAKRIIIHWEGTHRHGGAVVEELLEMDPFFPVDERVIILTTNPRQEDVYYFSELGVTKIVRIIQHRPGLERAYREIRQHFRNQPRHPMDNAWKRLQMYIDRSGPKAKAEHIATLEKALQDIKGRLNGKTSPKYFDALGSLCYFKGEMEKAEMYWSRALDLNPNFSRAADNLIRFYDARGEFDSAIRAIQRLNQRNKNSITRMIQLGQVNRKINRDDKAEHYFKLALEKDRYCSRALNGLAEIRFDEGNFDEAKALLKRSNRSLDTASYLNQQGIKLVKKGNYQEALDLYRNAQYVLPLQEKGPMLFYNMGLCYSRWGLIDKARDYLRLALIKKPDYEKAASLLERLDSGMPATALPGV